MYVVLLACRSPFEPWQKQVAIPICCHHPNAAWRFSSFFFFFSGMSAPEKVKKYSLHWTYIDLSSQKPLPSLAFDRNPSKSGQGPKLKLLDPSSYQALWHHFKMWRVHFRCSQNKLKIYSTEHVSDWLNINISKSAVRKMTIWSLRVF